MSARASGASRQRRGSGPGAIQYTAWMGSGREGQAFQPRRERVGGIGVAGADFHEGLGGPRDAGREVLVESVGAGDERASQARVFDLGPPPDPAVFA